MAQYVQKLTFYNNRGYFCLNGNKPSLPKIVSWVKYRELLSRNPAPGPVPPSITQASVHWWSLPADMASERGTELGLATLDPLSVLAFSMGRSCLYLALPLC